MIINTQPDVVLLDLELGDINGLDLIEKVMAQKPNIKFVVGNYLDKKLLDCGVQKKNISEVKVNKRRYSVEAKHTAHDQHQRRNQMPQLRLEFIFE